MIAKFVAKLLLCVSHLVALLPRGMLSIPLTTLFRICYWSNNRLRRTALTNLAIAFPEKNDQWHSSMLRKNAEAMAEFVVDALLSPSISKKWVDRNVVVHDPNNVLQEQGGVLLLGAHLGSFELIPSVMALQGWPLYFVVRPFKSRFWDQVWRSVRETHGSFTVNRSGGIRKLRYLLRRGHKVGILFDQNVTRDHAVFCRWFSLPAATSKAPALLALSTNCRVVVGELSKKKDGLFHMTLEEIDVNSIRKSTELTGDEKIARLSQLFVDHLVTFIQRQPEDWFWIHRRWKTRPIGESETVYLTKEAV